MKNKHDSQTAFFTRADGHKMVLQGAKILREIASLIVLGAKTSMEGLEETTDQIAEKYMFPRDGRHYDN